MKRLEDSLFAYGEMGALMREIDWAATPLGPVSGWSHALRTTVGLLLPNRFPLLLWWGPEFVQIYNDAYRPIPGAKHPRSLGQPAAECWSEIWDIIGPMIQAPFRGEGATWSDDLSLVISRKGFPEETHFKVAYSPVPDESVPSGIGGVLATVAEITQEIYGRRQLATLRDLAAQAALVKTAEEACARAAGVMSKNSLDVPWSRFYFADGKLASSSGENVGDAWPIERVMNERLPQLVDGDAGRAMVFPLASGDQSEAYGAMVVGASVNRDLDDSYRTFFSLTADHVSAAIRNARTHEHARERADKLAEIDRAKTLFFSNVSHEFRTPLTLMLAPIEELLAEIGKDAPERERVELLHRNARRLLKLVNALLDFSRIEAGRMAATFEPTDLGALTADVASSFRSAVERAGVAFSVEQDPTSEPTYVDRAMWEKIVLNLLSNAFKFTFEGAIAVRLRDLGDAIELVVSDTGVGIAPGDLPRIFERFHRIEGARARSHEGSGIGLALVQELVKMHGGSIEADSAPGRGTTFRVRVPRGSAHLPADQVRSGEARAEASQAADVYLDEALRWVAPEAHPEEPATGRERILVADDNADMREYVTKLLRGHWDVEAVADGEAALEAIRLRPPALVVCDVMMPRLDGFQLLRAVRNDPSLRATPFILLSARAGEESAAEGLRAGADDYLVKPFSARDLLVRVTARLAATKTSTDLYRAFMQAPFPVAVFRGATHVVEAANDAMLRAWGKTRSVLGQPLLEALPELDDQPFPALLDEVFRSGNAHEGVEESAWLGTGPGGAREEAYLNYVYAPLFDASGAVEGVMVCAFVVTDQVRSRQTLEHVNRTKDEFLATLSHELRTPLTAILGWAMLLQQRSDDRASVKAGLDVIARNARAQERIIADLLDVSRIVAGKLRLALRDTDIASVVSAAADVVRPAAAAKDLVLSLALPPDLGETVADADRLQQVVWNLLTNAVRFTPRGGRVTVTAERSDRRVRITVSDTGAGIPAEHLPFVFDRFRQVDSSAARTHGGLGLGLSIVRHLVEAHGGEVKAHSDGVGRGARFVVELPIVPLGASTGEGPSETPALVQPTRAAPPDEALDGVRVLVVDDDGDSRELMREVLRTAGAAVHTAASGSEALEIPGPFDVIVSDLGMPGMDGYSLMQRFRSRAGAGELPAIALSAFARAEDAERARNAGFQQHVQKPIEPSALVTAVKTWARRAGDQRDAIAPNPGVATATRSVSLEAKKSRPS